MPVRTTAPSSRIPAWFHDRSQPGVPVGRSSPVSSIGAFPEPASDAGFRLGSTPRSSPAFKLTKLELANKPCPQRRPEPLAVLTMLKPYRQRAADMVQSLDCNYEYSVRTTSTWLIRPAAPASPHGPSIHVQPHDLQVHIGGTDRVRGGWLICTAPSAVSRRALRQVNHRRP